MRAPYRFQFFAMGTQCELQLYARNESAVAAAAQRAIDEVLRIEARYSRYRTDSVLSAINRIAAQGSALAVDEETAQLLDYAYGCHEKSAGLFDISSGVLRRAWDFSADRLPDQDQIDALLPLVGLDKIRWERPYLSFAVPGMEIDFGGIAKEYAADQAAAACAAAGIEHGLVELGGDIKVIGPHPDLQPWHVGIRHPRQPDAAMTTVAIMRGAIAGSGDYERYLVAGGTRYCHILDPRTGWPVRGLSCVSVVTGQCLVAGSIATIAMLKGDAGKQWLTNLGVAHVWMDEAGNMNSRN
ncbi:MAG: FAD:protein FMN transferase [Gallionellaceae bacterium]|nr:MAG: FAD:protein FMN transferase [Gallionellaceae bacterium]